MRTQGGVRFTRTTLDGDTHLIFMSCGGMWYVVVRWSGSNYATGGVQHGIFSCSFFGGISPTIYAARGVTLYCRENTVRFAAVNAPLGTAMRGRKDGAQKGSVASA